MPRRPGAQIPPEPRPPEVHLARDHDRSLVAARVRDGAWVRVRPGAYVEAGQLAGDDAGRTRELARVVAAARQLRTEVVFSHDSAALLWGLPLLRVPSVAHVVQASSPHVRCSPDLVRHVGTLPPDQRTTRLGVLTTTLERTLVDAATTGQVAAALVVADAALHRGARRDRCEELLAGMAGRRGVAVARAVLAAADDGAESPGESLARLDVLRAGLPTPMTQVPVETRLGTFWADLGWPDWGLLAEYDGRAKYDVGRQALLAEKRREDAVREVGWAVLRITAEDRGQPRRLRARVERLVPAARRLPAVRRPFLL